MRRSLVVVWALLAAGLSIPSALAVVAPQAAISPFSDVANTDQFADAIIWLAEEGITLGCNPPANDRFCPGDPVTRGQMAAFLVRAFGYSDRGSRDFGDDDGSVFEADIERLATAGVTVGCNPPANDRFCPRDPVTREQMAAFLWRANGEPEPEGGAGGDDDAGPRDWRRTPESASDVIVTPATGNIASVVSSAPTGAVIRFRAGTYRQVSVTPRDGQTLVGDPGAVFKGSKVLTGAVSDGGGRWYFADQTQGSTAPTQGEEWGFCDDDRPACVYPEDVFLDGDPLARESSLEAVGAGEWYFDYAADRIYVGTDPSGRTVETSTSSWAFHGPADGVRIEGFVIEQYATPGRQGAINPRVGRAGAPGHDWEVVGNTVRNSHAWGIKIETGMVVTDNTTERNGQGGIGGVGDNVLIEHNAIVANCVAGYKCFGWEGGGTKFVTHGMVISGNLVTDNLGHGLHPDVLSDDVVIEENVVADNQGAGIHFETSTHAEIADNTVAGNGYKPDGSTEPGILVLDSNNVQISGNELAGNALGVLVRQDSRDDKPVSGNVTITGNTVVAPASSRTGVGEIPDSHPIGPVTFSNNRYVHVDDRPFTWDGTTYAPSEWQSVRNQDAGSTFTKQ